MTQQFMEQKIHLYAAVLRITVLVSIVSVCSVGRYLESVTVYKTYGTYTMHNTVQVIGSWYHHASTYALFDRKRYHCVC